MVRVQNPILWVNYHNRAQKLKAVIEKQHGKAGAPPVPKVMTTLQGAPAPLRSELNETFLWHGLNAMHIDTICSDGFDPRFCSLDGMFGSALYFAENSSKANQYSHSSSCKMVGGTPGLNTGTPCQCKRGEEVCMLLCRVLLGDSLIERDYRGNSPGQYWYQLRTEPKRPGGGGIYNSVVGESQSNYAKASLKLREYIVYEKSQVYSEYKVYFKRIP